MLSGLIVRPANLEDVETLVRFSAAMAVETEGRALDEDRLRPGTAAVIASREHGFYRVAERPGPPKELIGQLLVTYEWSDWRNANFWWIQSVYVHPDWRRQGVYRRMHQTIVQEARLRKDVCGIRLYVERENHVAQTVYGRVGLKRSVYEVFEEDFVFSARSELRSESQTKE